MNDSAEGSNMEATCVARSGVVCDRTVVITVGKWGGVYIAGDRSLWRVCLGFVAVSYFRGDFLHALDTLADALEAGHERWSWEA